MKMIYCVDKVLYLKDGQVAKYDTKENVLPEIMGGAASACSVLTDKMKED